MKTTPKIAASLAGSLVLVSLMSAGHASTSPKAISVADMLPEFDRAQQVSDLLPKAIEHDQLTDVTPSAVRHLGRDTTAQYWLARTGTSEVCFVLQMLETPDVSASSCGPLTAFYNSGISLALRQGSDDPGQSIQAYVFPSDVNPSDVIPEKSMRRDLSTQGTSQISPQLVSMPWNGNEALDTLEMERPSGQEFHFQPLGEPGGLG